MKRNKVELRMATGQSQRLLFALVLLCVPLISFSQSLEFQKIVSETKDEMYADGWEFMEDGYIDINSEWSIATRDQHFSSYTKYLVIVIVENSPLYSPFIEIRDANGYDHETINDNLDMGNYRCVMAAYNRSEGFYGCFVGKIHSTEMVDAYILLLTRDD